jgi:hypothetical protein
MRSVIAIAGLLGAAVAYPDNITTSRAILPHITTSFFVAKQQTNCSNLPGCPDHPGKPSAVFHQTVAQDGPGFKSRKGPTSLLPDDANEVLIQRFDLGEQYHLSVDTTSGTEKVLSCTKAPLEVPTNQTKWALEYAFGLINSCHFDRTQQCTGSKLPDCPQWVSDHTGTDSCFDGTHYTFHQHMMYLLKPATEPVDSSTVFAIDSFTNEVAFPPNMPAKCGPGGTWWNLEWPGVSVSPAADLFEVPGGCASVGAQALRAGAHPSVLGPALGAPFGAVGHAVGIPAQ